MICPAISVAMSVYNGERYLSLAIDSILKQSYADFEFLILDDGSTDGSAAIMDDFAKRDSRIRIIRRANMGLIVSLNQLIGESRAPLIARMDCDDIAHPNRFEKQISFLNAHPEYGVLGTWIDNIDADGKIVHYDGADHPTDHEAFLKRVGHGTTVCHSSVMMRRDLVLAVGGYHMAFKHCEDFDLWLRLASVTKLCSLPERLMQYRHWDAQVSNKHAYVQRIGAGISLQAYKERQAGRPDPTLTLSELPSVDQLDSFFGRDGVAKEVRQFVIPSLIYSEIALKAQGFDLLKQYISDGSKTPGLWRTIPRLILFGAPMRALGIAGMLSRRALSMQK
jgi:glycosyltransferase involved in cell wall biosynthesis